MKLFATILALSSTSVWCCSGFLPKHDLTIREDQKFGGLTRTEYNEAIDRVAKIYAPIVADYGGKLIIEREWSDPTVNAGTFREDGTNNWKVNMYGGFARHPFITKDGLSLVLCHEIGHHIGGAPKKTRSGEAIWAGTEGQSDYFATLKCLRKVFANEDNVRAIKGLVVPDLVKNECKEAFPTEWEAALCMRTSMAGLSVANVMADTSKKPLPLFDSPDPFVTNLTLEGHADPQCRLDTYFQGSVCKVSSLKPLSQTNAKIGTCHSPLLYTTGFRPLCWFRP